MQELIRQIVSQLGVQENQAQAGLGLLLKLAKEKLSAGDFAQIANVIDGVEDLINAAPAEGGAAGLLGGVASALGGGDTLGKLASLASGFKKLDLDPDMISKFTGILLNFLKDKGGDTVKTLLAQAME